MKFSVTYFFNVIICNDVYCSGIFDADTMNSITEIHCYRFFSWCWLIYHTEHKQPSWLSEGEWCNEVFKEVSTDTAIEFKTKWELELTIGLKIKSCFKNSFFILYLGLWKERYLLY